MPDREAVITAAWHAMHPDSKAAPDKRGCACSGSARGEHSRGTCGTQGSGRGLSHLPSPCHLTHKVCVFSSSKNPPAYARHLGTERTGRQDRLGHHQLAPHLALPQEPGLPGVFARPHPSQVCAAAASAMRAEQGLLGLPEGFCASAPEPGWRSGGVGRAARVDTAAAGCEELRHLARIGGVVGVRRVVVHRRPAGPLSMRQPQRPVSQSGPSAGMGNNSLGACASLSLLAPGWISACA